MQLAECLSERVRGRKWEHWCGSMLRWWRAAAEGNADWRLLCLLPYGLLIAQLRTRAHSYAQASPFQVEVTQKKTHTIWLMFCILVYQKKSCIWGIARFPLREPSTKQLLKKFRGNSIKNYADEQRLWLNWKHTHLSQVLCVINDMGVFVYTSELGVNKCASSASVVGFEVDGVRRSGWGLQQGFVLSYLWICVIAELTYQLEVHSPSLL